MFYIPVTESDLEWSSLSESSSKSSLKLKSKNHLNFKKKKYVSHEKAKKSIMVFVLPRNKVMLCSSD